MRFALILGVIFAVFLALTGLLHHFFRNRKYIKYIPALLALVFCIYNFYVAKTMKNAAFEDLARMVLAMMLFTAFVSGALTGLFADLVLPAIKKRK